MNIDNLKAMNIHSYNLPEEIKDGWNEMVDFIEDYNELRMIRLKMYFDVNSLWIWKLEDLLENKLKMRFQLIMKKRE